MHDRAFLTLARGGRANGKGSSRLGVIPVLPSLAFAGDNLGILAGSLTREGRKDNMLWYSVRPLSTASEEV